MSDRYDPQAAEDTPSKSEYLSRKDLKWFAILLVFGFLAGIPVSRIRVALFAIGGAMAAISGILLLSRLGSGNATAASGLEFDVIAAVVVGGTSLFGGRGRLAGTFFGALLIGSLVSGLQLLNVPDYWQRIVTGGVIVAAVILDRVVRRDRSPA